MKINLLKHLVLNFRINGKLEAVLSIFQVVQNDRFIWLTCFSSTVRSMATSRSQSNEESASNSPSNNMTVARQKFLYGYHDVIRCEY